MGEIDMENIKNMGYQGTMFYGNPSQNMTVLFDTGSPLAWLFSEKCSDGNCPSSN